MKRTAFIIMFVFSLSGVASAKEDTNMLENIHRMRMKQQEEETIVLRAQVFRGSPEEPHCSPVQQVRQRIGDAGMGSENQNNGNITINAGHGEINANGNGGTINSDVNVNVVREGHDRGCL
jgi:hypothetical protein